MGSQDTLIADLMKKPRDAFRDQLIANAHAGLYHDFKTTLATPKVQLVSDLTRYGYRDLARKTIRGEYDDNPDAGDSAEMDAMIASDPILQRAWDEMKKTRDPIVAAKILADAMRKMQGKP
jgi:hypothetical protein